MDFWRLSMKTEHKPSQELLYQLYLEMIMFVHIEINTFIVKINLACFLHFRVATRKFKTTHMTHMLILWTAQLWDLSVCSFAHLWIHHTDATYLVTGCHPIKKPPLILYSPPGIFPLLCSTLEQNTLKTWLF